MVSYKVNLDIYYMKLYHYTYRIVNKLNNKQYIGVRSSGLIPSIDLGKTYFSSSSDKHFIEEQKNNPDAFKYEIINTFENRILALEDEVNLHKNYDVANNEMYYNKQRQGSYGIDFTGQSHTEESKIKIGNASRDRGISDKAKANLKWQRENRIRTLEEKLKMSKAKLENSNASGKRSEEAIKNISNGKIEYFMKNPGLFTGKKHSVESKKKMSDSKLGDKNIKYWHGKTRSEETKKKISENRKGKGTGPAPIVKCPHCEKEGGLPSMKQWHFDNCKKNTNI